MKTATSGSGSQIRQEFVKFCAVGGAGFLIDAGVLQLCLHLHLLNAVTGRFLSFSVAVLVTYELNRRFVFQSLDSRPYLQTFIGYLAVQSGGFAINFGVYFFALWFERPPYNQPLVGLVLASVCALGFNFLATKLFIFR